jgi:hypothetical protein
MSNILKKYKSITLHHKEQDNVQIYEIYDGYILKAHFSSLDSSAYKQALECFTTLKNEN